MPRGEGSRPRDVSDPDHQPVGAPRGLEPAPTQVI
jgi:hypothetical protein